MKIYNELETLGFFEWLSETHNLRDTDMTPENLDKLPLNDIHRTVCNSMAFRWFREKHRLASWVYNSHLNVFFYTILKNGRFIKGHDKFDTYEEAELACIIKLIDIFKSKKD